MRLKLKFFFEIYKFFGLFFKNLFIWTHIFDYRLILMKRKEDSPA